MGVAAAASSLRRSLSTHHYAPLRLLRASRRACPEPLPRPQIVDKGLVQHVKREKDIMAECQSPFLVNLQGSFQDAEARHRRRGPALSAWSRPSAAAAPTVPPPPHRPHYDWLLRHAAVIQLLILRELSILRE